MNLPFHGKGCLAFVVYLVLVPWNQSLLFSISALKPESPVKSTYKESHVIRKWGRLVLKGWCQCKFSVNLCVFLYWPLHVGILYILIRLVNTWVGLAIWFGMVFLIMFFLLGDTKSVIRSIIGWIFWISSVICNYLDWF